MTANNISAIIFYVQMATFSIAVISCMVLIIALLIPLMRDLKTRCTINSARTSNAGSSASASTTHRLTGTIGTMIPLQQPSETAYSSFNLYLVYLAIPDLMLNLYFLIMYGMYANQNYNNKNLFSAFFVACSTANLVRKMVMFVDDVFIYLFLSYV
jgi:uncharacterized membrane protein